MNILRARTVASMRLHLVGENLSLFQTNLADIRAITTRERGPTEY